MTDTRPSISGTNTLRPRARILRTLGDELISSEAVALMELVKNSYDADATKVLVRFHGPLEIGTGKVEVIDNGHGMSLETIQSTWMEPATLFRKRESRSQWFGRRVLGEKGIGRFATSRLANFLEVVTRQTGAEDEIRIYFDWSQFDNEDKYLDEVEILWQEEKPTDIAPSGTVERLWASGSEPNLDDLTHGTILRMEQLRSNWGRPEFDDLRTRLSRLVSPFFGDELSERNDQFELRLDLPPPFEPQSGIVEPPELLSSPHYVLKGTINTKGRYDLEIGLRDGGGEESIQGKFELNNNVALCGPIGVELRVWDRDAISMSDLMKRHSFQSVAQVRRLLDNSAGISIYRDGFRVLPYGEPNDDWLRLDIRRVQNPTLRLSNNQVMGYVLISSEGNPQLRDQSNREGLIEGPPMDDLRELIKMTFKELEVRRYMLRHPTPPPQRLQTGGLFMNLDLATVRDYVGRRHPNDHQLMQLVGDAERELETRAQGIQEVLSRYQRLASLGQLIDIVLHDGRAPLAKIHNEATLGLRDVDRSDRESMFSIAKVRGRFMNIVTQSDALATIFRKIEPFGGRRRGRPGLVSLEAVIENAFAVLDSEIVEVGAEISLPNTNIQVTVDQAEIQRVIINLLQNSLYWLRHVPPEARQIVVETERSESDKVEIVFSDSGPGVKFDFRDRIFDPYFSTKPDGVGLGLTIAGEIVNDYYAGDLELLDSGPLTGATFRIVLRRRV
ncbi:MAG: ATP-binding protein [Caldilineaceae bacterium]|nr:ATP-binding protein [Caldilineaceae bacterium]